MVSSRPVVELFGQLAPYNTGVTSQGLACAAVAQFMPVTVGTDALAPEGSGKMEFWTLVADGAVAFEQPLQSRTLQYCADIDAGAENARCPICHCA